MSVAAYPAGDIQQVGVISGQVTPVDRFVVSDPVSQEMETLHAISYIASHLPGVAS